MPPPEPSTPLTCNKASAGILCRCVLSWCVAHSCCRRSFMVTGANSGIGFVTAKELAKRGTHKCKKVV